MSRGRWCAILVPILFWANAAAAEPPSGNCVYTYLAQWSSYGGAGQFSTLGANGMAVDASGNVYVADSGEQRVQKFSSDGTYLTEWGTNTWGGSGHGPPWDPEGSPWSPGSVAVDASGNIHVIDLSRDCVVKLTNDGTYLSKFGSHGEGPGQFSTPLGMAFEASGNVYVADSYNSRVQKFASDGTYLGQLGSYGAGPGQFSFPIGVAVDATGNVYVTNGGSSIYRVQKFDGNGTYITHLGSSGWGPGQFLNPIGVAVDASGNVYVVDASSNCRVQKFSSDGTYLTRFGSPGSGPTQFLDPNGVAVDSHGKIYVADNGNHRVQKFRCSRIETLDAASPPWLSNHELRNDPELLA